MSYGILKLAAIGGGTAAAGGGIIVGSKIFSEPKSETPKYKTVSDTKDSKEAELQSLLNSGTCIIYETEAPETVQSKRKFKKLKERLWSKEGFFNNLDQQETKIWNLEQLKKEVTGSCEKSPSKRVYLWWGIGNNSKPETWVYSTEMNSTDWLKQSDIEIPESFNIGE
ncbi:hypothetical protein MHF_1136 [Mycoplasma haemofelis Ohio2]|uniref:Uncharacterized protein n=1 Tax=Mycoplasma haemofelis (strain Ohio2) TaxID=859194 RepID=F6FJM4_MYCHI|nr:hypothetical protein MHF_1136 [Mycoplasma haemofelis Ohio2]